MVFTVILYWGHAVLEERQEPNLAGPDWLNSIEFYHRPSDLCGKLCASQQTFGTVPTKDQGATNICQTQQFDRIQENRSQWYKTNQRLRTAFPASLWKSAMGMYVHSSFMVIHVYSCSFIIYHHSVVGACKSWRGTRQMLLDLIDKTDFEFYSITDLQVCLFDVDLKMITDFPALGRSRKLSCLSLICFPAMVGHTLQFVPKCYGMLRISGPKKAAAKRTRPTKDWGQRAQPLWKHAMLVDGVGW